jgi:pimeloyl-ACP methyl ester carboxylesterase
MKSHLITSGLALMVLAALSLAPLGHAQAQVAGDWQGTLVTPGPTLHLLLHITAAKDGSLSATMDNVDQGGTMPLTSISLKDSKLVFAVDAAHITYEGTLNKDATEIDGTFTQGGTLPLNFTRAPAAAPKPAVKLGPPSDIDGAWMGELNMGTFKMKFVLHIVNTVEGLKATGDSPDQGASGFPASSISRSGSLLTVAFKQFEAVFSGTIAVDLNSIDSTFTQAGNPIPLLLTRVTDESKLEVHRPQNPVKPYPYREEDVSYDNNAAGNTLAGTLTVPAGKGPFSAVLLIVGSGPHDRDESLMGHKPFLVLADYLTRKGIVVLRVDKRGFGKSSGEYAEATTANFATDVEAGVAYLKTRAEVDPHKIGLIGHSEGGVIAPMVAARNQDVAFIVMMAGTGVPGDQIIVEQLRLIEEAGDGSKEKAEADAAKEREVLTLVESEKDQAALDRKLREKLVADGVPEGQITGQIRALTSPWYRFFISYDPAPALRMVKCPVLAINGSLDLQVPPAQNLPAIRKALKDGGNTHFEVDELPGLNHLFQTAKTGAPSEYNQIEETISPVALDKMASWILKQ